MTMTDDTEVLARTLFGEAEAQDKADAIAIASVALNRTKHPKLWPASISGVCLQPKAFSCWNGDNPRLPTIRAVDGRNKWYSYCYGIAAKAVAGELVDPTGGATHYFASYIDWPKWAEGKTPCYETPFGKVTHLFFNDIDTPKPRTKAAAKVVGAATVTAGAASAAVESGLVDQVKQAGEIATAAQPIFSLLGSLGPLLPYLLGAALVGGVGWLIWSWFADRRDGGRT